MTERDFLLPDLGEGLSEAEIVRWRVAVGDTVTVDQTVVEVETAKAVVDVPCPYAGRVVALHGAEGEVRPVGQPLITVAEPVAVDATEPTGHAVYREEERAGSGNVLIGYGTGHGGSRRRRPRLAPATHAPVVSGAPAASPSLTAASPGRAATPPGPGLPPAAAAGREPGRPGAAQPLVISPIVRRLARERGVDLATVRGSGPGGVVRRADVEAAADVTGAAGQNAVAGVSGAARLTAVPDLPAASAEHPAQLAAATAGIQDLVIPLTGIRRAIADKLSRSRREIPEVTIWVDADATALLETRAAINTARPDQPVSILALLARICLSGLRRYPQLNARVDTEAQRIIQSAGVHLGIAAQTDRGLVVPVLRDADRLTTAELAAELAATTAAARAGDLPPTRLTGGTFTLNNYGVFGVDGSTPIINLPEAALLGVGRIVDKPWVVDGQLAVRKVTQLSLTFDHRVCDGGVAGGFLRHVADCVEQPALLIANV
ncbi:pyruvate dehydrogenase E2 component (dihydrolipoamide acetyltransferase) [Micromonospora phaseoli]|uniref:Dihydrolipoamide acetyltransferase component of pyruvate dehydrogenase complex n=1 Tax=Micromonospora phaseoli TaxID=1144548 RepID=A0A1H6YSA6_9ACTN|nr:dihydrolipoamide acetyltransferase family protein [Micromonospora phaseoli]PZW00379.1 pyruvate dehydrogenase E2 component (dihydrolipoamide acetyltransferase) [Micromonospora phaseoli]GIJ76858.1 dihydrolipoamide acetyltransferase component of pyruvate dehydrogenase complex [Micromonospora phaseoli]SEJ44161.1 pyruvate dehydrogenase E2 component (dihydrolipoamide acetyltransferase) [Micromonospora phaseoli]